MGDEDAVRITSQGHMWMVPGQRAAQRRLDRHSGYIFPAFESLDIMPTDSAFDYVETAMGAVGVPSDQRARLFGAMLGFALTCVEADRENRDE